MGRVHPPAPWMTVKLREKLGLPECPYVIRWRIELRNGRSVRVHHWLKADDDRALHDHPWWFVTCVLRGGYTDRGESGEEHLGAGAVRRREALYRHTVVPDQGGGGAWTVLLTGKRERAWGFWEKLASGGMKFRRARRWFESKGHHPCE